MKKLIILFVFCTITTIAFAQQQAIETGLQQAKDSRGCYVAYPIKWSLKECKKWFSKHSEYKLIDIETKEVENFGAVQDMVTKVYFIATSEEAEYSLLSNMLSILHAGNIKELTKILREHPGTNLNEQFKLELATEFEKNYKKCTDMHLHNGIYTHTVGNALLSSNFYRKPSPEEKTLEEDMREFLLLCSVCRENITIKRAVIKYANEVKKDFLYYYDIFRDYGEMTQMEINNMDNNTYQAATTKQGCSYYLQLFPTGKYVAEIKALRDGGLYEKQIKELENAKAEAMKIIATRNGLGISEDIVVDKDMVSGFWSGLFGGSTTKTVFHADSKFVDMLRLSHNFKNNFTNDDPRNMIPLADFVITLTSIIEGLWASNITLTSSIDKKGFWAGQDSWEGYIQDGNSFWGTECAETPKCQAVRLKIEKAMNLLEKLTQSNISDKNIFVDAYSYILPRYSNFISTRDNNRLLCKMTHEAQKNARRAEKCAKCSVDWKRTGGGKIIMKNGDEYEYKYSGEKWRIAGWIWDTKFDTYEELVNSFLKECERRYCK